MPGGTPQISSARPGRDRASPRRRRRRFHGGRADRRLRTRHEVHSTRLRRFARRLRGQPRVFEARPRPLAPRQRRPHHDSYAMRRLREAARPRRAAAHRGVRKRGPKLTKPMFHSCAPRRRRAGPRTIRAAAAAALQVPCGRSVPPPRRRRESCRNDSPCPPAGTIRHPLSAGAEGTPCPQVLLKEDASGGTPRRLLLRVGDRRTRQTTSSRARTRKGQTRRGGKPVLPHFGARRSERHRVPPKNTALGAGLASA